MKSLIYSKSNNKRFYILLTSLFCFIFALSINLKPVHAEMPSFDDTEAAYVYETNTGSILTEKNATKKMYPASTTKLMTTLVALDYVSDKMDEKVTVGDEVNMISSDSSKADILSGESYTWEDLFYALLLPSGNDAAMTIAVNIAKIETGNDNMDNKAAVDEFVKLMNKKAEELGLENTHFANPHGLHDENHYTTAKDMSVIASNVLKNTTIQKIMKTPIYQTQSSTGEVKKWENSNCLIFDNNSAAQALDKYPDGTNQYYNQYAIGMKTGYTGEAGRCLVFASKDGDKTLIGVIFNASSKETIYEQADQTINSLHEDYEKIQITDDSCVYETVKVKGSHVFSGKKLKLLTKNATNAMVLSSQKDNIEKVLTINSDALEKVDDTTYKIKSTIQKGQEIGYLTIMQNDSTVQVIPLYASKKMKPRNFGDVLFWIIVVILVVIGCLYLYARYVVYQRKVARRRRRNRKQRGKRGNTRKRS